MWKYTLLLQTLNKKELVGIFIHVYDLQGFHLLLFDHFLDPFRIIAAVIALRSI